MRDSKLPTPKEIRRDLKKGLLNEADLVALSQRCLLEIQDIDAQLLERIEDPESEWLARATTARRIRTTVFVFVLRHLQELDVQRFAAEFMRAASHRLEPETYEEIRQEAFNESYRV